MPKTGGPSNAKRRWQEDDDESGQDEVTAAELEQWRKHEEQQKEEERETAKAARAASRLSASPEPAEKRRRKKFAWMDSDEEDDGDGDDGEDEDEDRQPKSSAFATAQPAGGSPARAAAVPLPPPVFPPLQPRSQPIAAAGVAAAAELQAVLNAAVSAPQFPPAPPILHPDAGVPAPQHVQLSQHMQPPVPSQVWNRPATPRVNQGLDDERLIGRIKRYVDMPGGGGYGFIDCEDTKLRFSRDVYIHKNQMHGLSMGDSVSFTIVRNNKGEPQARNVMPFEDALLLRVGAQQQAGDSRLPAAANQVSTTQAIVVMPQASHQTGSNLMDESQARQFQECLRASRQ